MKLRTLASLLRNGQLTLLLSIMSEGGGRLPTPSEMTRQLAEAGLGGVAQWSLIPGESFHAFVAVAPGGA